MIEQLLRDPNTEITDEFLAMALGDSFTLWKVFNEKLHEFDISIEWRHYKDGGWLMKATNKKRTIFWGSVSDGFFSASFNFPEKPHLRAGLLELDISEDIKNSLSSTPKGTFWGFTVDVCNESRLYDLYKLINYKKSAK